VSTRIYIASDLHAAEKAWRKFINAISLNVYKADVALMAGDLTGKAILPLVRRDDGALQAELFGVNRVARNPEEVTQLERDIADVGYYSFETTAEEADRLAADEAGRDQLLERLMAERLQAWLELATERLADKPVPLYLIPGNDDDFSIDEVLNRPQYAPVNVDGKVVEIPGGLQLLACGWSNHTPWNTPREETEDQLY
jgi:Icc-related predicted phosphoesterase